MNKKNYISLANKAANIQISELRTFMGSKVICLALLRLATNANYFMVNLDHGKVRFSSAPCAKKYCIHQGWINKANQIIICIPNEISISILGGKKNYDSINY